MEGCKKEFLAEGMMGKIKLKCGEKKECNCCGAWYNLFAKECPCGNRTFTVKLCQRCSPSLINIKKTVKTNGEEK